MTRFMYRVVSVSLYVLVLAVLAGCDAGDPYPNLYAAQGYAAATQQYVNIALQSTAEARQVIYDRQAQAAFSATMQAAQTRSASEAEVALLQARATAQQGDQNMIATATAVAFNAVATQQAYQLQSTITSAQAVATMQALEYEQASREVSLQVKILTAQLWGVTRWILLTLFALAVIYGFWRWVESRRARWSAIQHDTNGKAPIFYLDGRLINMDRSFYPVLEPVNPVKPDDNYQAQVVDADQKTDLARAVSRGGVPGKPLSGSFEPTIRFLEANESPPADLLPDPDVSQILDAEWRADE